MAMMQRRQRLTLPTASTAYLLEELAELSRSGSPGQRRRLSRTAITFRPWKKGRDAIPDHPIPLDGFKLIAIGYGWSSGRRGPRPSLTLGIYRASFDGSAAVPIRFRAEEVHDLVHRRSLTDPQPNATAIRSAVLLHQAVEDGDPGDFGPGLDWPRFFYGFEPAREPEFGAAAEAGAKASERSIEGLRAWPAELFVRSGGELLRTFPPQRVFASLAHLKGRQIRNPAFAVLKRNGLLPRGQDYRSWLASVSAMKNGMRVLQDPGSDRTEAGRLRGLIESHMLADRGREEQMLGELESACLALGMRVPENPERLGWLADLLDNPWSSAVVPYAARVQTIRLADPTRRSLGDRVSVVELEQEATDHRRHPERVARVRRS
jgi:hypothetical protein